MEFAEYDRMADLEDTMWWYRALHAGLLESLDRLSLPSGARVLDAGCGTGGLLRQIGQSMPSITRIGLEYDYRAARIAAAKSSAQVFNGTVNSLPFPTGNFDAIVSADVLYHVEVDEAKALAEFHRCLKTGGGLLLNLPAYNWMTSSHDKFIHTRCRYTARGARRLVETAGFRIAGVGYWNSLLFPLMLIYRMSVGRTSAESDVHAFPRWQDGLFYAITSFERKMARVGWRLPFGGSVWISAVKP